MFTLFRKKAIDYFTDGEKDIIRETIEKAEKNTTGEIRIFVEHYCPHDDAIHRAKEVFYNLQMDKTLHHNGVLLYMAIQHRKLAIYADSGIYERTDKAFWNVALRQMKAHFKNEKFANGMVDAIKMIGENLSDYFPEDEKTEKNTLPDELVFGKN